MPVEGRREGRVYWVVLNRPEKLNALDEGMWRGFRERLVEGCGSDATIVAVRGAGRAFCTGDDIAAMEALRGFEDSSRFFDTVASAVRVLMECAKPVAALVHGYAYGGCAEILLLMDYVVAVKGTRIAVPEARLALIPPLMATLGTLLLGRRARTLALSGAEVGAEEARLLGLVDEVVESAEEGVKAVEAFAEAVSQLDPEAVARTRRLSMETLARLASLWEGLHLLTGMVLKGEARRRMRAFLEKRL